MTLGYDTFSTNEEHKWNGKRNQNNILKNYFYRQTVSLAELDSRPIAY